MSLNLSTLKNNELLSKHTTFKIGGPAEYFLEAENIEELKETIMWVQEKELPFFILGGGSNVLVSDEGFAGLVIKINFNNLKIEGAKVTADAGVSLTKLVMWTVNNGLKGLEWAVGIPGTVGGAVRGNAGAWGGEMKDFIKQVIVLRGGKVIKLNNKECCFAYRHSIFKNNKDIILQAIFQLETGSKEESKQLINTYIKSKSASQALQYPSSGCIFKNIFFDNLDEKTLQKVKPFLSKELIKRKVVPAGLLIDEVGCKGMRMGKVAVSDKHANFIINLGGGTAEQVVMLMAVIKERVRIKFGIQLQEEVQLIGL